jgi:excisionase family DNA binding protein
MRLGVEPFHGCNNMNFGSRKDKMENGMIENGTIATVMAVRRWLTLEQLLEVLPLKKSYVYYLTHTRQIPVTRIGRRLLFDYDRIVEWLEERTVEDGADVPSQKEKRPLVREISKA